MTLKQRQYHLSKVSSALVKECDSSFGISDIPLNDLSDSTSLSISVDDAHIQSVPSSCCYKKLQYRKCSHYVRYNNHNHVSTEPKLSILGAWAYFIRFINQYLKVRKVNSGKGIYYWNNFGKLYL